MKQKAIVILSGGQDSVTCLYWALKQFDNNVEAITFYYGQRHSVELKAAEFFTQKEKIPHHLVDISFLPTLIESALTSDMDINAENEKGLPASFVPNRNQLFITLAHAVAQKAKADHLVMGVCQTDFSGYPDCRQMFINAIEYASNLGSLSHIKIHTPLMNLSKAETFWMAENLGVLSDILNFTHTCYNGDHQTNNDWGFGCGECAACKIRKKGYEEFMGSYMPRVE